MLLKAVIENPPVTIRDGGVIARGYDAELDELLALSENAGNYLVAIGRAGKKAYGIIYVKSRLQPRAWLLH